MLSIFIITTMELEGNKINVNILRDQYVKHINGGLLSKKMLVSLDLQSKPSYERMVFPKSPDHKLKYIIKLLLK